MVAHDPLDARPGWVYRSDSPARTPAASIAPPPKAPAARFEPAKAVAVPARSWIASSLYLMALPLAVGMTLMLTPVAWVLGSRSRE